MTTGYLAAQTPQINIPFLNIDGTVSQVWLLFLIQLFQRTGGNTSPTYTLSEIEKLALLNLSVVKTNGFNGIVTGGQNSTLTIETTVSGIVKGNGTALSAATPGVDYSIIDSIGVTVPASLLSVTPSSLSSSGTFAISLTTQTSNTLLAGPITGVGATPTFRGLVSTDIPALNYVSTLTTQGANQILAGPSSGVGAAPTFRSLTTADIPALPYGSGTVTSVGMSVPAALLSVAPSTITTSGTFALSLTTQTSAQILASPISTIGTPSFRSLVSSDIPALNYVSSTTTQAAHQVLAGPITGTSAPTFRSLVSTDIPALPYGTGTVTSVGLALPSIMSVSGSPVTTTGTLTGTLTTQAANSLFAGPISGVGATPTFRALTTADIAGLGVGTVTSVGMTVPSILSVTPSTITTSGSFALSLTTESANQIFAGPSSGSAATPTFRALTSSDLPSLTSLSVTSLNFGTTGLTPSSATQGAITVAGTLSSTNGGTGLTTYTAGDLPYYSSGSALSKLGIGTSGQVLTVVSGNPAWATSASTVATNLAGGTTGAVPYQSGVATTVFLSGNTSTTPNFLTSTGTGTSAQAPTYTSSTGTGNVVLATSPTLVTPALGTPSSGVVTNLTGTAAINITGTAPAGTLTGTTLNSTVVTSSLTSVGTIGTGTWQGTKIATGYGGTGLTSFTANQIFYASSTSVVAQSTNLQFNGTTLTLANDLLVNGITAGRGSGGISTNTVFGNNAFANATPATGTLNAAFGDLALASISSGAANNGIGHSAGSSITSGNHNICVGYITGNTITTGSGNVIIGSYSGVVITTGGYNTQLGYNTTPSSAAVTGEMIISSGNQNATGKGANTGFITPNGGGVYQGNNSASWSTTSDQRIKENIVTLSNSLSLINQLRPVSFDYIIKNEDGSTKSDISFIAQEYQKILPNQVNTHSASKAEYKLTGSDTLLGITPNLTPYLVNAIQELSAQITSMQALLKSANITGF